MTDLAPTDRLLRAAETLFAERGLGASLEEIASVAGLRNKSAVHYYFGSRDGLIAAAVKARLGPMETVRMQMLADSERAGTRDDVRTLISMLVLPIVEIVDGPDSTHFGRFFDRVRYHAAATDVRVLAPEDHPALRMIIRRISDNLPMVAAEDRRYRTDSMSTCLLGLVADYEEAAESLSPAARLRRREELIDVLTGLVTAPASTTN